MSQIAQFRNPWRDMLMEQASFRGVMFHVETGSRSSGRRTVVHEYPKRNDPYSEDMGRQARRFGFSGYLIYMPAGGTGPTSGVRYEYTRQRQLLYEALENDDSGRLVHPVFAPHGVEVMCERYSMVENRTRGGFTEFEMQFVEVGSVVSSQGVATNTVSNVKSMATLAELAGTALMTNVMALIRRAS